MVRHNAVSELIDRALTLCFPAPAALRSEETGWGPQLVPRVVAQPTDRCGDGG
jgi:hypothetical protein